MRPNELEEVLTVAAVDTTGDADGATSRRLLETGDQPVEVRERETTVRIAAKRTVADDVVELVLEDAGGAELPSWTAGAHIDLLLGEGVTRQYSLCGSPRDTGVWQVAVLRDPQSRGGSRAVHEDLQVGDTLVTRGPRNHFHLVDSPRYLFIAGGIGVTPLLAMAESLPSTADWTFAYGGRQRRSMAYLDRLAAFGDHVQVWPQDEGGLLELAALLGEPQEDTVVYCCGPEGLLAAVEQACSAWPGGALHVERFAARPRSAEEEATPETGFEVELQQSGVTLTVPPGQSIFEACEAADVMVLGSCFEGTCGTCEVPLLAGEADHRDSVLSDAERASNEMILICVSRARTPRLVLDL
jgi:ferredoxin-NADP reductase